MFCFYFRTFIFMLTVTVILILTLTLILTVTLILTIILTVLGISMCHLGPLSRKCFCPGCSEFCGLRVFSCQPLQGWPQLQRAAFPKVLHFPGRQHPMSDQCMGVNAWSSQSHWSLPEGSIEAVSGPAW